MSTFRAVSEAMEANPFELSKSKDGALFLIQVITSFLSVFATIVVVRISVPKLDSTYQRYIFMLNMALLINSIFLGLHPILSPSDSAGYWSVGNSGTCTTVGFFLVFGSIMVSLYHTAIAFYFYFSVATIQGNYNNRNQKKKKNESGRRVTRTSGSDSSGAAESSTDSSDDSNSDALGSVTELAANIVCLFLPVIFAGTGATKDYFDFNPAMNLCTVYGSNAFYEDDWKIMRDVFMWIVLISGVITVLITIVVRCRIRFFQKKEYDDDAYGGTASLNNRNSNASGSSLSNPDGAAEDFERQIIGQKLSAIAAQCLYYTVSYVSSYVWFIILAFMSSTLQETSGALYAFQLLTALFFPLLGVFNCAIYVRPRVQMLHIMYPEDSNLAILRVAMSKAGDPEEIEEVRAKIYGDDYYAPEEDEEADVSNHSGDPRDMDGTPSKLQVPTHVEFGTPGDRRDSSCGDERDSVSQISDM